MAGALETVRTLAQHTRQHLNRIIVDSGIEFCNEEDSCPSERSRSTIC